MSDLFCSIDINISFSDEGIDEEVHEEAQEQEHEEEETEETISGTSRAHAPMGWTSLRAKTAEENPEVYQYLRLFSDVLNIVQDNYVEKADLKKLMYGSVSGMLRELDPHSSFLKPEEYKGCRLRPRANSVVWG